MGYLIYSPERGIRIPTDVLERNNGTPAALRVQLLHRLCRVSDVENANNTVLLSSVEVVFVVVIPRTRP